MAEQALIVAELKRALRERRFTYAAVAKKLNLSIASVKRLFSGGDLSLKRVDLICELLETGLSEILARARERPAVDRLTLAQEQEIVADPKLFLIAWLLFNRVPLDDIVRSYAFTEREVLRFFYKLDQLKVIELQPGNRVRLLVSRHFSWRAGGPVQRYIHQKLLREFMSSHFVGPQEEFFFHGGAVSEAALGEIQLALRNTSRQCAEIIERDRGPRENRRGAAFLLALRPWKYGGFRQFER
ncbi:MAG TPA: helix-turn-helix transcriptional regulator [Steroidobacteraceae bacterium]|nr:helix-turn-helix transcriptional regulator [Steroidobacteraceae bacterium]